MNSTNVTSLADLMNAQNALAAQEREIARKMAEIEAQNSAEQAAAIEQEVLDALQAIAGVLDGLSANASAKIADEIRKMVTDRFPKMVAPKGNKNSSKGVKVAAKYRDNTTGETWSGRGLKPKWLAAAMAGGIELQTFAV